jgi:hypothetical protein
MNMVFCRGCGGQIHVTAHTCPSCGAPQQVVTASSAAGGDEALKYLIPVGRSGWAVAAGYLAFFAIFALPAPFALAAGILGLRDIKQNPEKLGKGRAIFGIVMGGLGCLILLAVMLN